MSGIVVCGGGVCGLTTAMMLARDGHRVTVLERDAQPPPEPGLAWDGWERRGVRQFRLPHFLLPAFREVMDETLPEVIPALLAGGASRFNLLGPFADALDPEGHHEVVTARRPLIEATLARLAQDEPGLVVRRGVAVAGVVVEGEGPPRVTGVRTEAGETIAADLVVDAAGRRSPMARWVAEAGARPPIVEEEDSGFVYYGRHVRAPEGLVIGGPGATYFGSVGLLRLPAEAGVSGVGIIAASDDAELRQLRHEPAWRAALAIIPGGDPVLRSEPIGPLQTMAGIEDRWRRYVVDGGPVVTGMVSVADAWAATNPTLGRGISLGARHARELRDLVREVGLDPVRLVTRFDEVTQEGFTPWYRSTVWHDRHRVDDLRRARTDDTVPSADHSWETFLRFETGALADPTTLLPRMLAGVHFAERPDEVIADPGVLGRLDEIGAKVPEPSGPTRQELLAAISG